MDDDRKFVAEPAAQPFQLPVDEADIEVGQLDEVALRLNGAPATRPGKICTSTYGIAPSRVLFG